MSFKFPKCARLKRQEDFALVRSKGERKRAGQLILSVRRDRAQRLGVTISGRVGCAVERNRIRRVVRDFFRLNREAFPCGDIVIVAMPGLANRTNDEIRGLLKEAAGKFSSCKDK